MDVLLALGILLFLAGFILIGIEMVVPGFGAPGICGIICLIAGVFVTADTVEEGAFITVIVLALLGIMMAVILWLLSKGKLHSPIVLEEEQKKEEGYISSGDLDYLLGKQGTADTDLRPTGVGNFDGVSFDVLSEGKYISKGAKLEIIKVSGSRLIVRELKNEKQLV